MRRSAAVVTGSLLALGLLAGCDLPGGSPRATFPDQMPNNSAEEAPTLHMPAFVHGTLDPQDDADFFALTPPLVEAGLSITCSGDVEIGVGLRSTDTETSDANVIVVCDGQPHSYGNYAPSSTRQPVVAVLPANQLEGLVAYSFTATYGPLQA